MELGLINMSASLQSLEPWELFSMAVTFSNGGVSNCLFQVFTYEEERSLRLLEATSVLVENWGKLTLVWRDHAGRPQRRTLSSVLLDASDHSRIPTEPRSFSKSALASQLVLNEGYVRIPMASLKRSIPGLSRLDVHLSVSPNSRFWQRTSVVRRTCVKPTAELKYAQSIEKAAVYRGENKFPTALELTLAWAQPQESLETAAIKEMLQCFRNVLPGYHLFGTADVGGDWLFVPKSGFNPNVAHLSAYFSPEARLDWKEWRERHNLSFIADDNPGENLIAHSSQCRYRPT